jgi:fatty acid desaturase
MKLRSSKQDDETKGSKKEQLNTSAEAFKIIKQRVKSDKLLYKQPKWSFYWPADGLFWMFCSVALLYNNVMIFGALMYGFALGRCGWIMHVACHNALFNTTQANRWMANLFLPFAAGPGVKWWKFRHNKHHAHTNEIQADPDLRTNPLVVYSTKLYRNFMTKYQRPMLPLYLSLYIPMWTVDSFVKCLKYGWYTDIGFFILGYSCRIAVAYLCNYTMYETLVIYALSSSVHGIYLGGVFMTSHFLEDVLEDEDAKDMNLLEHTLKTTRNTPGNMMTTWITGGLNYQIEHHLFTSAPIENLSAISKIVKEEVEKTEMVYKEEGCVDTIVEIWDRLGLIADASKNL